MPHDVGVIIPAGGAGVRAGSGDAKQFRPIAGKPMLRWALEPFLALPQVVQVVIALPPATLAHPPAWLPSLVGERLHVVTGGTTRAMSVFNAFGALAASVAVVLVHDAARPFVPAQTVERVLDVVAAGVSAVAAVPVTDTLKRAAPNDDRIVETVDRRSLWQAQTPQGFPRDVLRRAYEGVDLANTELTDESALVERAGFEVRLVADSTRNVKVTTQDDFVIAEALARP